MNNAFFEFKHKNKNLIENMGYTKRKKNKDSRITVKGYTHEKALG